MQEVNLIGKLSTGGTYVPVINPKTITENGTYTAPEGVDGYNPVTVNVSASSSTIEPKTITENGTYNAPVGIDGFNPVTVQVAPLLEDRYINANGQYDPTEGYDGIRRLTVEVPVPSISPVTLTENGVYTDPLGNGYNPITVNVQKPKNILFNKFQESNMIIKIGLYGDINSVWDGGNAQIGGSIQGSSDIGAYNTIKVKGTITNSYAKVNNSNLPRVQFVVGVTDIVFNSIILVDYNTANHIIAREDVTLYDKELEVPIDFSLDISGINSGYFFVSLLGITINDLELEFV